MPKSLKVKFLKLSKLTNKTKNKNKIIFFKKGFSKKYFLNSNFKFSLKIKNVPNKIINNKLKSNKLKLPRFPKENFTLYIIGNRNGIKTKQENNFFIIWPRKLKLKAKL